MVEYLGKSLYGIYKINELFPQTQQNQILISEKKDGVDYQDFKEPLAWGASYL